MRPVRPQLKAGPAFALRNKLQAAYAQVESHFEADDAIAPAWAEPLPATIPFVGAHFDQAERAPRVLVYGSAEHLGTSDKDGAPWMASRLDATDRQDVAWRRGWKRTKGRDVLPHTRMGIAPYENGLLWAAAMLLWRWEVAHGKAFGAPPTDPVRFTEHIAVANFSKFALPLKDGRNVDPRAEATIRHSLPYVYADIECLRPTVVLVAKTLTPALAVELTQFATSRGAKVIYTIQGSGQGPFHSGTHLGRMTASPHFDLALELGSSTLQQLLACPLVKPKRLLPKESAHGENPWFALLKARYLAVVAPGPTL